jgi:hypothetical protein
MASIHQYGAKSNLSNPLAYLSFSVFFRAKNSYLSPISQTQFYTSLSNPDPRKRPHPSLVYSILLLALDFADVYVQPVDFQLIGPTPDVGALLARIQACMHQSLADVDRIMDYLQASSLLIFWYYRRGRLPEAHYLCVTTSR